MPDKLTDKEIVKLLECCKKSQCSNCEYSKECDGYTQVNYALNLINRLQEEIQKKEERLHNRKAEVNRLNSKVRDLKKKLDKLLPFESLILKRLYSPLAKELKVEAYKECIEKAKEIMQKYCGDITEDDLDNILKELVGD
jgi:archaellum component FlaC